ncbi:MAG: hypothetical protein VYA51_12790 [Planctomycetota bacterium]|nr:hypothetical protein [Planctomycetota bacterium]
MSDPLYIRLRFSDAQRESEQDCELDGVRVRLAAAYNATAKRWYLHTFDTDRNLIVGSIALVCGVDLWRPYKHLALPQGALFLEDPVLEAPASLESLDVSALLKYRQVGV